MKAPALTADSVNKEDRFSLPVRIQHLLPEYEAIWPSTTDHRRKSGNAIPLEKVKSSERHLLLAMKLVALLDHEEH
jgi:hypothetical protein